MNMLNNKKEWNFSKILNVILFLILSYIIISIAYKFLEPNFVLMYKKGAIISNVKTVQDLEECAHKYYDALIHQKNYIANEMLTIFNQKKLEEIEKIKIRYGNSLSYDLNVKEAHKLRDNLYFCNIEIIPKNEYNEYVWNDIRKVEIIIRLDVNNYTFKILYDNFNLN